MQPQTDLQRVCKIQHEQKCLQGGLKVLVKTEEQKQITAVSGTERCSVLQGVGPAKELPRNKNRNNLIAALVNKINKKP